MSSTHSAGFEVKPRLKNLATWTSRIRSSISESDVSLIRRRFYIPDNYQIIVPGPNGRIDKPPHRCLPFHVAALEAGLRFPLARPVEEILSGLNVCPAQLTPNSYRHILSFIILMRHFQVDPSFVHFCHLISTVPASKTGEDGFFSLTPKPKCKLLCNLHTSLGRWKYRYIYIKPPVNCPWKVPICWNIKLSKPYVPASPSWGHSFISNQLTLSFYNSAKILKEEVLVMVGLSPAPIETTHQSLEMAVRASMVAKAMREHRDALLAHSQPVVQEPEARKRARSEEVRPVDWVRNAEKIARGSPGSSSSRDGENGLASLVFKLSAGEDTVLEKYRYTIRETDQLSLVDLPLTKLEDVAAYHSHGINSIIHHLHLRAACLQKESTPSTKLDEVNEKANDQVKCKELEQSLIDTKHENVMLRKRAEESFEAGRAAGRQKFLESDEYRLGVKRAREEAGLLRKRVDELERENVKSFDTGWAAGRQDFVESDEYRSAVKRAREEGVRAFVKSNTYATLVAKSAAVYEFDGFEKCRAQATKLGAFTREFDPRRLNPLKNGDFEDPVFEDEAGPEEEDEFAKLL